MSDTTETETETNTNTDEPSKAELHDRVKQLESTVEKLMPSRRDALKLGAAGIAGAAGLSATSGSADAATGSAGQIGDSSNRPDIFADTVDANQLSGVSTGADRQGCRVFLGSDQGFSPPAKIPFDNIQYDTDNNFDTTTHAWTCPKDGLYMANAVVRFTGGSGGDTRAAFIGDQSNRSGIAGKGAVNRQSVNELGNTLPISTVNQYQSGDTIAVFGNSEVGGDTFGGGNDGLGCFLEVAFLGSL